MSVLRTVAALLAGAALLAMAGCGGGESKPSLVKKPAAQVDPFVGTANGGNTYPGATLPFGMVQFSPEESKGEHTHTVAPGGYQYAADRIRGFSLTHLSGTGCRGASGDVPLMPHAGPITTSPSADADDSQYADTFSHANEHAGPGYYDVRFDDGMEVALTATVRTGRARITFPAEKPANVLVRVSDSEVGSSAARVRVHPAAREVTGAVTSGNFCGYIDPVDRRSYYTLYFVAAFDRPFARYGTWHDGTVVPSSASASGGTGWDAKGMPVQGRGSGAWVGFDTAHERTVQVRVGVSYVSLANARANLEAEDPQGTTFADVRESARRRWNEVLRRIGIGGGTAARRKTFYTALYHVLLEPNTSNDVNGEYRGFDGRVHHLSTGQRVQYANFSGWDVYRSQLQLLTLLDPRVGSDIAQSLYNQARQNGGDWDRWTHESGATHVMEGDPSPAALADIAAFGGARFDLRGAYHSLARAATVPTRADASAAGCPVECVGQRTALADWLKLHYIPTHANAWGGAGETLEDATADFALSQLAARAGDGAGKRRFLLRSGYWRNLYNPSAGYVQDRNADGSWPPLDPSASDGFAEGSAAQYTWMVPFDVGGLFAAMGGRSAAAGRLDAFFHQPGGGWALTRSGGMHAELANEPSIETPWLYDYAGRPYLAQQTIRRILDQLWRDAPGGIPGNDDLGEMSSWYVWAALGMYPEIPGRAELLLASPLFPRVLIRRGRRTIDIRATGSGPYVQRLDVDGKPRHKPWLPESFVHHGGRLDLRLSPAPDTRWGAAPAALPPSFAPAASSGATTAGTEE